MARKNRPQTRPQASRQDKAELAGPPPGRPRRAARPPDREHAVNAADTRAAVADLRRWLDQQTDDETRDPQYVLEETARRLADIETTP